MSPDRVVITTEPINLAEVLAGIQLPVGSDDPAAPEREIGALVTFSGIVRETEGDAAITHLDYEHYEGMAQQETLRLVEEARRHWPLQRVAVHHRVGPVAVGEASVIVAVAAGHRDQAFQAARYLIDQLKLKVPIWKTPPS